MDAGTQIGHMTVCRGMDLMHLKEGAFIGKGNWIYGYPTGDKTHFAFQTKRRSELCMGEQSAITSRHLIDCTNIVEIGKFTIFAGYQSQILTHSIDLEDSRQSSAPISIGSYCFIGTNSVILGGSALPDCSVLAAKSLLTKKFDETYHLYGGVPAQPLKALPREYQFFSRKSGFVY